jgi:hypothetical protein
LVAVPNQAISFNVDGAFWQIRVFQAITHMCADVKRNGEDVIRGVRCYSGEPLMPYDYMHDPDFGNFIFDGDPDWTNFGSSVSLLYLDKDEYAEYAEMARQGVAA